MLYNVTFHLENESTRLVPQIPYSAADDEDQIIPRVCFAESIEDCLSAIGSCNRDLHTGCRMIVRSVDESHLNPEKLISPEKLFEDSLVPDALETREWWYLDEVDVKRDICLVKDFSYEYGITFSCVKRDDFAEIMGRYVPNRPLRQTETPEMAYGRVVEQLYLEGRYEDADRFEDEVAELPWAKCIKINDLKLKKFSDKN